MMEELFTDAERHRLIYLLLEAMAKDPTLDDILSKLTGTDTVIVARRAYCSKSLSDQNARDRAKSYYSNPNFPKRICYRDDCGREYRGPSVYCSLECVELDAGINPRTVKHVTSPK